MTRVTNLAQFDSTMSYIMDTQKRMFDAQLQVASGHKSQDYAGIARNAGKLLSVETQLMRVNQYIENNELIDLRLQTMESNVSQLFDVGTELRSLLVNALNADNALDLALIDNASIKLDQVIGLLNAQQDGRYLFAGSRTTTAPVDRAGLPGAYTIPTANGDSVGYYQGDSFAFTLRADDGLDIDYGIRADATGFEQLIRALHLVETGAPGDRARIEHALDVLNEALNVIPDIRTTIGAARETLSEVNSKHSETVLYAEQRIGDLENVDVPETITRLNSDQVALEASYMTVSRLTGLSLLQFMR